MEEPVTPLPKHNPIEGILQPLRTLHLRPSLVLTVLAGFFVTISVFIINAYVYHRASRNIEQNEQWVAHTHEVINSLESLLSTAKDAETGQRGYLLTGREEYLKPYNDANDRIDSQVASLRNLVSDNPLQSERAARLEQSIRQRFDVLDQAIQLRRSSDETGARALILSGTGKVFMDSLRGQIEQMEQEERRLLGVRAGKTAESRRRADLALVAATLIGLVLVTVAFWALHRHLKSLVRQQEADRAVELGEAKLQGIIGSAMDAIISVDEHQRVVLFNRAAEKIFGRSAEEAIGQSLDIFIPARYREDHRKRVKDFGRSGVTTRSMNAPGVLSGLRANGEEFPIEATISNITVGDQKLYTVILRDITDRKRTEEQLQQAQKMEAVGRLAGGIAHDFNNLLGIIIGYSELLANAIPARDERRQWASQITTSAKTGALLTRQLLAFSRKQTIAPQYFDLAQAVRELEPMLRRLLREDIELVIRSSDQSCPVKVDPGHIQQLLLNLVANARDAMSSQGILTIEVRNVELDEAYVRQHQAVTPGKYVMLAVSDTGIGMPPEVAEKIFEPFFTTKAADKGTGLGLATVYGIVKQNGGDIWVYSEPGVGTIFKVYLPRMVAVAELPKPAVVSTRRSSGRETLLVVEDSLALRLLTREVLSRSGYRVLEAEDGVDALKVSSDFPGHIDLLLTDVVMPRMRGPELAQRIVRQRPEIEVIFMSGYSEEALNQVEGSKRLTVLEKPYTSDALLSKIREVLDSDAEISRAG